MFLQPHCEFVTREGTGHSEEEGHGDVQATSRWDKLVAEFHDIFDPPGMPAERDTLCKGCNGCVLCSTTCNTALHSTAPMWTAIQCHTGITYT